MGYDANDRLMEKGPEALLRHFDQAKVRNGVVGCQRQLFHEISFCRC